MFKQTSALNWVKLETASVSFSIGIENVIDSTGPFSGIFDSKFIDQRTVWLHKEVSSMFCESFNC